MHDRRTWPERVLEHREHLGEGVGADDQHRVRLRHAGPALLAEHVTSLPLVERVGGVHVQLGVIQAPDRAPSASATAASSH